jgi:luciferase family oxidoreductase group 1
MPYVISLLDKSPVAPGLTAVEALQTSVAFAQAAERLGYHRLWLAEHHGTPQLASSAPEVVAAHLLALTKRIRIGTGGVLLQHYSPYKVAEVFGVLSALAPGRVDLGIGKAPGGLPFGTRALQSEHGQPRRSFEAKLEELEQFLTDSLPESHALHGAVALPRAPVQPQKFLLGASPDSAALAARLGWDFTYAGHHDGNPDAVARALAAYEGAADRKASLALAAIIAPTRAEAEAQGAEHRIYKVTLADGQSVNLPTPEAAAEYARQAGNQSYTLDERRPSVLIGTGAEVRAQLDSLHHRFGVTEFILDIPTADRAARLQAIELLANTSLRRAA